MVIMKKKNLRNSMLNKKLNIVLLRNIKYNIAENSREIIYRLLLPFSKT